MPNDSGSESLSWWGAKGGPLPPPEKSLSDVRYARSSTIADAWAPAAQMLMSPYLALLRRATRP